MSFVISSILPFPNIKWWSFIITENLVKFDLSEHFEKMSYRNRYYVATANGVVKLSIPMRNGRDHKMAMNNAGISYDQNWQLQHWRTLVAAYNRSPYFDFYAPSLEKIFKNRFEKLIDFNLTSIHWLKQQLKLSFEEEMITVFQKDYDQNIVDLRKLKPLKIENSVVDFPKYFQVFEDRIGFQENLSMLDLLFSEGPYALNWLKENKDKLMKN